MPIRLCGKKFAMRYLTSFRYATLVWLTGLMTVPSLFLLWGAASSRDFWGNLYSGRNFWAELVLGIAPWSIPSWLIFIWATYAVCQNDWGVWQKKWRLFWQGLLLILVPNIFVNNASNFFDTTYMMVLYWIPALLGVFLFRLPTIPKLETPT